MYTEGKPTRIHFDRYSKMKQMALPQRGFYIVSLRHWEADWFDPPPQAQWRFGKLYFARNKKRRDRRKGGFPRKTWTLIVTAFFDEVGLVIDDDYLLTLLSPFLQRLAPRFNAALGRQHPGGREEIAVSPSPPSHQRMRPPR